MYVRDSNYVIPTGYHVLAAPGASAMDEKYFKNPTAFDPYRWEEVEDDEEAEKFDFGYGLVNKGTASPYLPFGAGRHRCIGEQFANVQLGSIIATFVREFEFSLPGDGKVPPPDYTVSPKYPSRSVGWSLMVITLVDDHASYPSRCCALEETQPVDTRPLLYICFFIFYALTVCA
jgi:cytochrome P450